MFPPFQSSSRTVRLYALSVLLCYPFLTFSQQAIDIGVSKVDITPQGPVLLTGYASRSEEATVVDQRLWAKAVAFGRDEEGPTILITVDLLGIAAYMGEDLANSLAHDYPIKREQLSICATHTHAAPAIGGVASLIYGELPADQMGHIAAYTTFLQSQLEKVARDALANRQPSYLSWGQGKAEFATNRRVLEDGKWVNFGVVPDGPVDHDVPVMKITDTQGKLRAVWINYACHCTTLGGEYNQVHGDWAGTACTNLEAEFPESISLVSIGCGADANPQPRGKMEHVLQHGKTISDEVIRILQTPMKPLNQVPKTKWVNVDLPFAHVPDEAELIERGEKSEWKDFYAKNNLERLINGEEIPAFISYPIQSWTFGEDLAVVFLAGEVVVDYALRLKSELDRKRLWLNAYANDAPCYIASKRVIEEGGYEAESSMYYYNKPSPFQPIIEDRIVHQVKQQLPATFDRPSEKPESDIRLIIRSDDMGCSHATNEGIVRSVKEGITTSIEIMVPTPWFPEAVEMLKELPDIDVGIHLVLTSEWTHIKWRPLTQVPSLTDEWGYFYPMIWRNPNFPQGRALQDHDWKIGEIEQELRAQIELAKRHIPQLSHLSGHMGCMNINAETKALYRKLAEEYELDIFPEDQKVQRFPGLGGHQLSLEEKRNKFLQALESLKPGTYLFVEHPAEDSPEQQTISHPGYENVRADRAAVLEVLTHPEVREVIDRRGIQLIDYRDLKP